jgi:hypothetical protein
MMGMFSFIVIGGFCILIISSRRGRNERYLDHRSLKNYNSIPKDPGPASSADADGSTQGYEEEIADMIKIKKEGKVADSEYYQRMDGLANKYNVNYSKIMSDISKGMKEK